MPFNVRFSGRPAKAADVLCDEREVLELSRGGLGGSAFCGSTIRMFDGGNEFVGTCFHFERNAI